MTIVGGCCVNRRGLSTYVYCLIQRVSYTQCLCIDVCSSVSALNGYMIPLPFCTKTTSLIKVVILNVCQEAPC